MDRGPFLLANPLAPRFQEFSRIRNTTPRTRPRGTWEGDSSMQHITCDLCGKELRPGEDPRYVVKIEAYAAHDPAEITEADLDEDHMEALSKTLHELEENEDPDSMDILTEVSRGGEQWLWFVEAHQQGRPVPTEGARSKR